MPPYSTSRIENDDLDVAHGTERAMRLSRPSYDAQTAEHVQHVEGTNDG
jgi:hypothetical protein